MVSPRELLEVYRGHGVQGLMSVARYGAHRAYATARGPGRLCPICGWRGRSFRPLLGPGYRMVRTGVLCPTCDARERHRAYYLFYQRRFLERWRTAPPDLLHFAPERCLQPLFQSLAGRYDRSSYPTAGPGELLLDLEDLALPDESYDVIVLNHVLLCIEHDDAAIRSLHRVLRPGGVVLAGDHVTDGEHTVEYERPGYGGVWRNYAARELPRRFAPFQVEIVDLSSEVSPADRRRYGLAAPDWMVLLRKS